MPQLSIRNYYQSQPFQSLKIYCSENFSVALGDILRNSPSGFHYSSCFVTFISPLASLFWWQIDGWNVPLFWSLEEENRDGRATTTPSFMCNKVLHTFRNSSHFQKLRCMGRPTFLVVRERKPRDGRATTTPSFMSNKVLDTFRNSIDFQNLRCPTFLVIRGRKPRDGRTTTTPSFMCNKVLDTFRNSSHFQKLRWMGCPTFYCQKKKTVHCTFINVQ